jgi:hypothetical protein
VHKVIDVVSGFKIQVSKELAHSVMLPLTVSILART